MADGYVRSRSYSNSSLHSSSDPAAYVETRIDYEDEGMCRAFKDVAKLGLPITITSLFVSALLFCNLVWIGHHASSTQYAGAALGNMLVNVMGNSIIIGMTTGLDTQCGQAFGAQVYKMVGVFAQRSVFISHFVIVIVALIFWFGKDILIGLGQDHDASTEAGIFVKVFIASLWPIAMFANLRRFLQSQRKVFAIPIAVFLGLCAQIVALLILVNFMGLGFEGACIALPTSYWTMFGTLFFFTKWKGLHLDCWPGWGKYAFQDWFLFLKLSLPGTMMLCAEWWAFEVLALVAGTMNKTHADGSKTHSSTYVAAFTTCLNILGIFIRIPLGISFASAVLVSNKLGAKLGNSARMVFNAALILSVSSCFFCSAAMFFFPHAFATVYTHDTEIVAVVQETLPYMAVYFWVDSFQRCCAGATRGMGRQSLGAGIYVVSYYFIGMPIGIWFAKEGLWGRGEPMYLKGLWVGAGVSVVVCSFFFICLRLWVNWDHEVVRAQTRIEREQQALEKFKADLADKLDQETIDKLLREPHPSVNEGHYIKYSEGGHQHIHITEESVSGKKYNNLDDIEYEYDDMTFDEVDHTMNDDTLDSNVLRHGSMGNSLQQQTTPKMLQNGSINSASNSVTVNMNEANKSNSNNDTNGNKQALLSGSLPSISQFSMKKSVSQPGYGYPAPYVAESNDMSSKRISVKVGKDSMDDIENDSTYDNNNNIDNNTNTNMTNGNIDENDQISDVIRKLDSTENENENEHLSNGKVSMNGGHYENETQNIEMDDENTTNVNENANDSDENNDENDNNNDGNENEAIKQNGTSSSQPQNPRKTSGLQKSALKKKKKRKKNKNKKNKQNSLGHSGAKQKPKHRQNSHQDETMD